MHLARRQLAIFTWTRVAAVLLGCAIAPGGQAHGQTLDEPPRAEAADPETRRDALLDEANQHISEGRFAEAAASAEAMLAVEREWLGEDSEEVFSSLQWLSEIYAEADDVARSTEWARQTLVWAEAHLGADHWQTVSAREDVKRLEFIAGLDERRQELLVDASAAASLCNEQLENEDYEAALASAELATSRIRDVYGDRHLEVAACLQLVAEARSGLGEYAAAETALREALAIDEAVLGASHPTAADDRYDLARVLTYSEQYAAAREQFQAAAEIYDRTDQIADAAWSHSWIGDCWQAEGNTEAAISAYALAFARNAAGELPEQRAELLRSLADIYTELNNYAAALPLMEESAALHLELYGEASADYLTRLDGVAELCRLSGDYARAIALHENVLAARAEVLGKTSLDYSTSLNNLGLAYAALGRCDDSVRVLQQAVELRKELLGEEHEWFALSLLNLAQTHMACGDFRAAEPLTERARDIFTKVLGPRHTRTVASINNLALIFESRGDYSRAEALLSEALSIRRETPGVRQADLALSLSNLALLLQRLGDYARAEALHLEANAIRRELYGEEHPDHATGLNNLGLLYSDMGDYPRAEPLLKLAAEIRRRGLGEAHVDYAVSLSNLGLLYQRMGDFTRAKESTLAAMAILEEQVDELHPYRAVVANNLAWLYTNTGERDKAGPLYLQAIELQRAVLGENHPEYATSLLNLASLYQFRGEYALAAPLYDKVLEIRRATVGERHPHYAITLNNLAMLHMGMGKFDRAEDMARQGYEIYRDMYGPQHPDGANLLNNLASVSQFRGDHAAAAPLIREAIDVMARHLTATAVIQSEQEQIALGQAQRFYLDNYLSCLLDIGDSADAAYRAALNWKGATLVRQRAAREAAAEAELAPLFAELQSVVRRWAALVRTPPDSLANWREQVDALTARKNELEAQLSDRSAAYRDATSSVTLDELHAALPEDAALVDYLEFDRSTIVEDPVRGGVGVMLTPQDGAMTIGRIVPGGAAAAAGNLQVGDVVLAVAADGETWQDIAGWDLPRVVAAIGGEAGAAVRLRVRREGVDAPLELAITRAALPMQRKYRRETERRLAAFVVRPDRDVAWFDLGPVAPLAEAIDRWRDSKGVSAEAEAAGRDLRAALWQPLMSSLGDARTILVSPDGALGRFPLAALPGREPGTYLIEDHHLALVPVAQLIPALVADASARKLPKELLLLGDVDYDARAEADQPAAGDAPRRRLPSQRGSDVRALVGDRRWEQLVGARDEVAVIRDLYRQLFDLPAEQMADLHGAEATEQRFRELAPQCYQLHIATHGFFAAPEIAAPIADENLLASNRAAEVGLLGGRREEVRGFSPGLLSGLVLAGANNPPDATAAATGAEPPEDGILTADEIAFLPLAGVRLAVLSACETGLGEAAGGEGLLGIQRAFQVAGVRATIATLWKVNDLATRRIMEQFYRNYLDEEMSPLDALRAAQIWALHNPDLVPRGADAPENDAATLPPEFWAAFILSGDWR